MDEVGHQPDADERGNDGSDEAEGKTPAYHCFRDKTNDGCYDQVDDHICAEGETGAADSDGDSLGEQGCQNVHSITPLYFEMKMTSSKTISSLYTCKRVTPAICYKQQGYT